MTSSAASPLRRERNLILAILMVLAVAAWALLLWQASLPMGGPMPLTMGMSAPLFLAIWIVMMVAMMFPAAAPMIVMFEQISAGKQARGQAFIPTWVFVGGYLAVWSLVGIIAYLAALGAEALAGQSPWLMANAGRIGGGLLVLAGVYQLSPLKRSCLTKCRTPMQFIMTSWRDGRRGALRMGLEHGGYCLGCCWLLFVLLFPLGIMNIAAMAVITLLIFAEKSLPWGQQIARLAAVALVVYGLLVVFMPELLPGSATAGTAMMDMQ